MTRSRAVRNHPALPTCLVRRVYSYGVGAPVENSDKPLLDFLNAEFVKGGYRLPNLLRQIVLSPAFYDVTGALLPEQKTASK